MMPLEIAGPALTPTSRQDATRYIRGGQLVQRREREGRPGGAGERCWGVEGGAVDARRRQQGLVGAGGRSLCRSLLT